MNKSNLGYSSLDDDYLCVPKDSGIKYCNDLKPYGSCSGALSNNQCTKDCKPACFQFKDENSCNNTSSPIISICQWVPNTFYSCNEQFGSCVKSNNYLDFANYPLCNNSCEISPSPSPSPTPPSPTPPSPTPPSPPSPTPPSPKPPSKQSKKSKKSHLLLWLIPLILIGLIFMGIFIYFNFF